MEKTGSGRHIQIETDSQIQVETDLENDRLRYTLA